MPIVVDYGGVGLPLGAAYQAGASRARRQNAEIQARMAAVQADQMGALARYAAVQAGERQNTQDNATRANIADAELQGRYDLAQYGANVDQARDYRHAQFNMDAIRQRAAFDAENDDRTFLRQRFLARLHQGDDLTPQETQELQQLEGGMSGIDRQVAEGTLTPQEAASYQRRMAPRFGQLQELRTAAQRRQQMESDRRAARELEHTIVELDDPASPAIPNPLDPTIPARYPMDDPVTHRRGHIMRARKIAAQRIQGANGRIELRPLPNGISYDDVTQVDEGMPNSAGGLIAGPRAGSSRGAGGGGGGGGQVTSQEVHRLWGELQTEQTNYERQLRDDQRLLTQNGGRRPAGQPAPEAPAWLGAHGPVTPREAMRREIIARVNMVRQINGQPLINPVPDPVGPQQPPQPNRAMLGAVGAIVPASPIPGAELSRVQPDAGAVQRPPDDEALYQNFLADVERFRQGTRTNRGESDVSRPLGGSGDGVQEARTMADRNARLISLAETENGALAIHQAAADNFNTIPWLRRPASSVDPAGRIADITRTAARSGRPLTQQEIQQVYNFVRQLPQERREAMMQQILGQE